MAQFKQIEITAKNNQSVMVREACVDDAQLMLDYVICFCRNWQALFIRRSVYPLNGDVNVLFASPHRHNNPCNSPNSETDVGDQRLTSSRIAVLILSVSGKQKSSN